MIVNAETRKDKRWAVMVKPNAVVLSSTGTLPLATNSTFSITDSNNAVAAGATLVKFRGNIIKTLRMDEPYKFYTSVTGDTPELVYVQSTFYNTATGYTEVTLTAPVARAYGVGSRLIGGAFITTLAGDHENGTEELQLNDTTGLAVGMYLALEPGTSKAEVVQVTQIIGSTVTIADSLYFDHSDTTTVNEVNKTKYEASAGDIKYRINFDVVYGKLPGTGTTYARLCGGDRNPWIQVAEITSFDKAKDKVNELAGIHGLDNVRILRVVDLYSVLYPIS